MKKPTVGSVDLPETDASSMTVEVATEAPVTPAADDANVIEHPQEGGSFIRNADGSLSPNKQEA